MRPWVRAAVLLGLVVACSDGSLVGGPGAEAPRANAFAVTSASVLLHPVTGTATLRVVGDGVVRGANAYCRGTAKCTHESRGDAGTFALLEAVPDAGSRFHHWDGACRGTSPKCLIRFDAGSDLDVRAWFAGENETAPATPLVPLEVWIQGSGTGDVTADGFAFRCAEEQPLAHWHAACSGSVPAFQPIALHAHARPGSRFEHWFGGVPGNEAFTVVADLPEWRSDVSSASVMFARTPDLPRYRAEVLPLSPEMKPAAFAAGRVVGVKRTKDGERPFLFDLGAAGPEELPDLDFRPSGVTRAGVVTGSSKHANEELCRVFRDGRFTDIPGLPGDSRCELGRLNVHGRGFGSSTADGRIWRHFLFDGSGIVPVESLPGIPAGFIPTALGDDERILGIVWDGQGGAIGYEVANGIARQLGAGLGASLWPILAGGPGQAAGYWNDRAILYADASAERNLGVPRGWYEAMPRAMNVAGTVVGEFDTECPGCDYARRRAFVADATGAVDLNEVTDTGPYELVDVVGIDDASRIVATSPDAVLLLTPVRDSN